jgi:hypothetical protein
MIVHIDRLAPAHLSVTYLGVALFYSLGFAIVPILGGFFIR